MQKVEQKPKRGYRLVTDYFKNEFTIPSDWDYVQYRDILIEVEDPIIFNDDANYKLITAKRRNGGLVLREILKGSEILTKNLFSVEKGDFIIAKMQIIHGACGLVPESLVDAKISGSYVRFKSKDTLDLEYLNWFSHTPLFYKQTFISSVGSNLEKMNFNKKHWLNHLIPLPPINEQRKISSILSSIDLLIQQTQKIIEQTQKIKKGLMQKLLIKGIGHTKFKTIKFLFNKPENIPENWNLEKLKLHSTLITKGSSPNWQGFDYQNDGTLFITSQNIGTNEIITKTLKFVDDNFNIKNQHSILQKGDVLTNIVGASIGRSAIFNLDVKSNINQAVALIRLKRSMISEYLVNYLNSPFFIKFMIHGTGETARPNLSLTNVGNFPILVPPLEEQQKIALILSNVDLQIQEEQEYKSKLEILKKGLMQKLLTGKIRVKV